MFISVTVEEVFAIEPSAFVRFVAERLAKRRVNRIAPDVFILDLDSPAVAFDCEPYFVHVDCVHFFDWGCGQWLLIPHLPPFTREPLYRGTIARILHTATGCSK
jgi:hypothetical protein